MKNEHDRKVKKIIFEFSAASLTADDVDIIEQAHQLLEAQGFLNYRARVEVQDHQPKKEPRTVKAKCVGQGNRQATHKDSVGEPISVGDDVTILNNGKIGKVGETATVTKLAPNHRVCYKVHRNKEIGQRVSHNLKKIVKSSASV